jgi:chemotaxis protein MotB
MAGHKRHKKGHHEEEHENEERWLVSFADMMTLLFCLFMVLFAISSVNTSKFEALQRSLQDAFSGAVLSGGKAMMA